MDKLILLLFAILIASCSFLNADISQPEPDEMPSPLLDSLRKISPINQLTTFDINDLQTDDFKNMIPISKSLYQTIYPDRDDYIPNTFFIQSYLPSSSENLLLITYQKNQESENTRVDYIDLINIDRNGQLIETTRLAAKDDEVINYEVKSHLNNRLLRVIEHVSSESSFDPNQDTLFSKQCILQFNGKNKMDTLDFEQSFVVRKL